MIVVETEEEKRITISVATVTIIQPPGTTNTPREKIDVSNEKRISLDSLTETLKLLNRLTLQSTINNSADDHLKKRR